MRKLIATTCAILSLSLFAKAQMDESIQPRSFAPIYQGWDNNISEMVLPALDATKTAELDMNDAKNGKLPLFSRNVPCHLSLTPHNFDAFAADNEHYEGWISVKKISAKGAQGLVILFDKLYIPEGATLHVYSADHKQVLGAYTHENTPEPAAFNAGLIAGETCFIEYFEPVSQLGKGIIEISEIGYAYRWVKDAADASAAGSCEVNVACAEAANWANQVRGVARILVIASGGQGYCTGSLINNVRQDCTPYFLSAQHCSENATAAQYNQWIFYFNYQASTCAGTTGPQNKTVNGCTEVAQSDDNGGDSGSDFLLLQLKNAPPSTYNVYYNGWDASGTMSPNGVSIHHPDGDIKKISTYTTTTSTTSWGGSVQDTHLDVKWAATANGHGVTEPGSSGSPLFDNSGNIIGTLTGGNSYCNTPNSPDQYGRVYYDWVSNGSANNRRLRPWLDPDNTGITNMAGTNAPCGGNVADDAGILAISSPEGNLCATTFAPSFVLRNYGNNSLTSVTINYEIDGNVYQYNWSGNLAAGGSTTVTLASVNISAGSHTFTAATIFPNGHSDNNTVNDSKVNSFTVIPPTGVLNLNLRTDSYGSETSWTITSDAGDQVAAGGPYGNVTNGETMNIPVCIGPGCYTFTIYDSYGDGMDDGGSSNFSLAASGGSPVYATLTTRNFGNEESHAFCIAGTGIVETEALTVRVVPNPSNGMFNLSFEKAGEKNIKVLNGLGQLVTAYNIANTTSTLDLSHQAKGVYLLWVETTNGRLVKKLVIE